jgi:5'-phosphate synthase pdxT subunit
MDTFVERNAFGRQLASFETDMSIPVLGETPFHTIFIRAPYIEKVDSGVNVLLAYENKILFAEQDNLLAAAFHPELTDDIRIHAYFLRKIKSNSFNSLLEISASSPLSYNFLVEATNG